MCLVTKRLLFYIPLKHEQQFTEPNLTLPGICGTLDALVGVLMNHNLGE